MGSLGLVQTTWVAEHGPGPALDHFTRRGVKVVPGLRGELDAAVRTLGGQDRCVCLRGAPRTPEADVAALDRNLVGNGAGSREKCLCGRVVPAKHGDHRSLSCG